MKRPKWLSATMAVYFGTAVLMAILPFLVVVVMSITKETDLGNNGFNPFVNEISLEAYKILFQSPDKLLMATGWTLFLALTKPLLSCVLNGMAAYALAQQECRFKGAFSKYMIYCMLISAGMIPSFIVNTKYYGLMDNPLIFYTSLANVWSIILYRTFFREVPRELIEAARIDGAGELQILWKIMLPAAKSVFAMQFTLGFVDCWNGVDTSLYYIMLKTEFYELQYFLNEIMNDLDFMKQSLASAGLTADFPTTTIKYAVLVISLLPIFVLFPYMQKFFAKGMVAGSVKG